MVTVDKYLNVLECNQYLRENIDIYKEAFKKFYGSELEQFVEEQFSKALFIGYISPKSIERVIDEASNDKSNEIYDNILKKSSLPLDKEDLFKNYSLEYQNLIPLVEYQNFYNEYLLGYNGRKEEFINKGYNFAKNYFEDLDKEQYLEWINSKNLSDELENIPFWVRNGLEYYADLTNIDREYYNQFEEVKELLDKINPNITVDNFDSYVNSKEIKELNHILEMYEQGIDEYNLFMSSFSKYKQKVELEIGEELRLEGMYFKKLIKDNIDLLSNYNKDEIEDYINGNRSNYDLSGYINSVLGVSLGGISILDAFSSKSQEILNDEDTTDYEKQSIIDDRIKFFNINGIDLGVDYDLYLKSDDVKRIWPSMERVDKFLMDKEKFANQSDNEFYSSREDFIKIREEIGSLGLLDKNDSFKSSLYNSRGTFVNPNIIKKDDGYELCSLVVINFDSYDDSYLDHYICHELNHLFELFLKNANLEKYTVTCGWDILNERLGESVNNELEELFVSKDKRSYELFNEIINELIAQEISGIMQKDNMHVFNTSEDAKYIGSTSYENSLFIVNDFYNEFKDKIIESRRNGNINTILDEAGRENFEELNDLFAVYYKEFSGMQYYSLAYSLKNNEDTSQTRKFYEVLDKKDEIMDKMRNYKENSKRVVQESSKLV